MFRNHVIQSLVVASN